MLSIGTVTINDDPNGTIEFVNTYEMEGEGEVILRGTKTLSGDRTTVKDKEFQFGLYDANGDLVESVKNDVSGNFQFATLKFDETDVPVDGQKQITYTVKEIAPACGFSDEKYFSRLFKKTYGCAPSQLRRQISL